LLITGGVSVGVADLVPGILAELGVTERFHKVRIKPGKPVWFGTRAGDVPTLVFGLPGNPVSMLVAYEVFVKCAIQAVAGGASAAEVATMGCLLAPVSPRGKRPTYHPCPLTTDEAGSSSAPEPASSG